MKTPKWLENAIFYEIYPQSFKDTNGDGIGDLKGIISKLDYVCSLGCNAIWLNPIFDSPFKDAGYDVRDYKKIAKRYGTLEDLDELIREMHKRNMHLLLDLVPCHTSDTHPWFKKSRQQKRNKYSDRYIWTNSAFEKPQNGLPAVGGIAPRNGTYVISYFHSQPSLNYGFNRIDESWQHTLDSEAARKTKEAIIDVMRFYLSRGVDGFRVDMAACLVKNDTNEEGTMKQWESMFNIIKKEFPNSAFVAEWAQPTRSLKCGFDMDFYLDHGWDGGNGYHHLLRDHNMDMNTFEVYSDNSYFKTESNKMITKFLNEYMARYNETKDIGYSSFMSNNHDMARLSHFYNEHELKLIYCFLYTMPGVPFLYYGDEIMMSYLKLPTKEGGYHRTGARSPMQWDHSLNAGFSSADSKKLYLPIDKDLANKTVKDQLDDEKSMLNHIRRLFALRNENECLRSVNNINIIYSSDYKKLFIYERGNFVFVCNPSLYEENYELNDNVTYVYGVGETNINGKSINIKPSSFAILKKINA